MQCSIVNVYIVVKKLKRYLRVNETTGKF